MNAPLLKGRVAVEVPLLNDRAAVESPLMEDQVVRIRTPIELRAEVTWPSSNTLSTQDNHNLGKFDPSSGRASGQVEQVAAKQVWPSLPVPHPSINEVMENQAPLEDPLP